MYRKKIIHETVRSSIGTVMDLFRTGCSRYRRAIGAGYVETIRNIPVLVWIFIFYDFIGDRLLPVIGIDRTTLMAGGFLADVLHLLMVATFLTFEIWLTILAIYLCCA